VNQSFNWLSLIPGFEYERYGALFMTAFVMVVVIALTLIARLQLMAAEKREDEGLLPDAHLSFRNFFEIIAEKIYGLCEQVMGKDNAVRFFPIIGTLFVFIFASNILGLIPGVVPSTENLNTTLALGIFVFLYYNYVGIRDGGMNYLKHFMGPVLWLSPLIFVIEIVGQLIRPFSLGLRLRGNIMGDHIVLGIFNGLLPYLIPVIFYGLGLFVAFVQAFVFCLMTMIYISLAAATGNHEHH
jgi:F-type H+-transporting ATPase subunit a